MGFFLGTLARGILTTIVFLPLEFLASLANAGWLVLMFNLAGIPALASIGYWSLVWICLGVTWVIESAATISHYEREASK
jgi:hypothetical protein